MFFPNCFCLSSHSPTQKSLSFHHRVEKFLVAFSQSWDPITSPRGPISPDQVLLGHSWEGKSCWELWTHSSALVTHSKRGERRRQIILLWFCNYLTFFLKKNNLLRAEKRKFFHYCLENSWVYYGRTLGHVSQPDVVGLRQPRAIELM